MPLGTRLKCTLPLSEEITPSTAIFRDIAAQKPEGCQIPKHQETKTSRLQGRISKGALKNTPS